MPFKKGNSFGLASRFKKNDPRIYHVKRGRNRDIDRYVRIYKPDHPYANKRGYIYEHRYIMELFLERYLDPKENIHHIDKNTRNNHITNLELFPSKGDHLRHEFKGRPNTWQRRGLEA